MALDELFKTFEILKKRIEEHRDYLSQDETRTRQVLIDPLLKALGWDVGDPNAVELEHRIDKSFGDKGVSKPDYALMHGEEPTVVVEAKTLASQKLEDATKQVHTYAIDQAIPYGVATDGDEWRLIDVRKPVKPDEKVSTLFQVSTDDASKCALSSLALWRPNVCAEGGPVEAIPPVIGLREGPPPPPPDSTRLSELNHTAGMKLIGYVTMPDESRVSVKGWKSLYFEVARHLWRTGALKAANPPFGVTSGNRYAVNYEPVHSDGKPFVNPRGVGDLYLETNNSAPRSLQHAKDLISACGGTPTSYLVHLD